MIRTIDQKRDNRPKNRDNRLKFQCKDREIEILLTCCALLLRRTAPRSLDLDLDLDLDLEFLLSSSDLLLLLLLNGSGEDDRCKASNDCKTAEQKPKQTSVRYENDQRKCTKNKNKHTYFCVNLWCKLQCWYIGR